MIETRGKNKTLVVSKSAVPVLDVCDSIIASNNLSAVKEQFPVSDDEIFECLNTMLTTPAGRLTKRDDYIDFTFEPETSTFVVHRLSQLMYFNLITFGRIHDTAQENFEILSVIGLKNCLLECLTDMAVGSTDFMKIGLHKIVFNSLNDTIGDDINFLDLFYTLQQDLNIEKRDGVLKVGTIK